MTHIFNGIGTAIITPFDQDGNIQWEHLDVLINMQLHAGIKTLIVNGTTAEAPTLSSEEQTAILDHILEYKKAHDINIIFGVSTNNTAQLQEKIKTYNQFDIDGYLVLTPYYNRANDEGMYAHFATAALVATKPIILYHIPGRTGCSISFDVLKKLKTFDTIAGIKFADTDYAFAMQIIHELVDEHFAFYSGNDDMTFALLTLGAQGAISAASNIIPQPLHLLYEATAHQDYDTARAIHYHYLTCINQLFMETNPIPVKYALAVKGLIEANYRLPLTPPSLALQEMLKKTMEELAI